MKSSIETRKLSQNPDDTGGGKKEVKKVVDTIEFIGGSGVDQEYIKAVKELFSKLPEDSSLRDSVFVMAEIENEKYRFLQDFGGITEATDILVKNPNKKVLLFSTLKLDTLKRLKPDIQTLMVKKNFRFMDVSMMHNENVDKVSNIFNKPGEYNEVDNKQVIELSQDRINQKIGEILHRKHLNYSSFEKASPEDLKVTADEAREYFPAMNSVSDKEVVEFLFITRQNVPEVMKGQQIEGVYCDIEGTLLVNSKVNEKVLQKLKEYESQGKKITLWTDGNIEELQNILTENNITYPLKSKIDHAGAIAETVIDNDDENTFNAKTKIYAKEFIKV